MNNDFPLFPTLTEEGQEEAQKLIDAFKIKLVKAAEEVISALYCDIATYIESDSWTNFRNELLDGFRNYNNRKIQGLYDFQEIRKSLLKEFKEEIIYDLNQDLVEENQKLKEHINILYEQLRRRY